MNGWNDDAFERAYGPGDADEWGPRLDDDAQAYQAQAQAETPLDCPYCGLPVDVLSDGDLFCDCCYIAFADLDDLLNERATLAAQGWVL